MKKTVRYEVRCNNCVMCQSDNVFMMYESHERYTKNNPDYIFTIHEITTIEKDITETAKGRNTTDEATKL